MGVKGLELGLLVNTAPVQGVLMLFKWREKLEILLACHSQALLALHRHSAGGNPGPQHL